MFKYLVFCLAFINVLSGMISNEPVKEILQAFADLRADLKQDLKNENALNFLRNELKDPKSPIWIELGKMMGLSDYDRLEERSKHLSLLSAKAFIESGGLDILYLWGGRDFAKEDLITVRDYLWNLPEENQKKMITALNLPKDWDQFNPAKIDPNLDNPFLVEDSKFNKNINKWIEEENEETGLDEKIKTNKPRAKTNALGLLTRLLLHTDSDGRLGTVARSLPVVERLFSSKFIANLLILLEESRLNGQLVYSLFFWLKPPSSDGRDFSPCFV